MANEAHKSNGEIDRAECCVDVINPVVEVVEAPRSGSDDCDCYDHRMDGDPESDQIGAVPSARVYNNYVPTNYEPDLTDFGEYIWDCHVLEGVSVQLNPSAWLQELKFENDGYLKSYLKNGVIHGFDIVDRGEIIPQYDSANYRSATQGPAYDYIDSLIQRELREDKYILQQQKPRCIHSLGAVPKTSGKYRPITDCRQPLGESINNFMEYTHHPFVYKTVDDVINLLHPGSYTATVDISAAYRTVPINPSHRTYQGVRWTVAGRLQYLVDTHMCFGLKCAPFIFTQIGNFVIRCMQRRGYTSVINYIDDFICVGSTFQECQHVQKVLVNLLIRLGFRISWDKCTGPSQYTRYLGLFFDMLHMRLILPDDKLHKLHQELRFFQSKKRATCHQLQKLCGILAHCAKIVHGGRTFSHRIIQLLKGLKPKGRVRLTKEFLLDIRWWMNYAMVFNGSATMIKHNFGQGPWFCTDASSSGYGIYANGDWMAGTFIHDGATGDSPEFIATLSLNEHHCHWLNITPHVLKERNNNVNFWEMIPVWLAIKRYAKKSRDNHIVVFSDNLQVVYAINKGFSENNSSMRLIREIFWECAYHNVYLTARYIRGIHNEIPDTLSRLNDPGYACKFMNYTLCCRSYMD